MNWANIATVALTATVTILASLGVVTTGESTDLTTSGAQAIAGVAAFVAAIVAAVKARKGKKSDGKE